jgi:hypothetical protein
LSQLAALNAAARALLDELRSIRAEHLHKQLSSLGVTEQSRGLQLHIGCGSHLLSGWLNIDKYPAPLSMSALWSLPLGDATVSRIFVRRMPECLFFPVEIREFLFDMRRVLVRGGVFHVAARGPSVGLMNTAASLELSYKEWARSVEHRTRLDYLLATAATDFRHSASGRVNMERFTVDALIHMLAEERFTGIRFIDYSGLQLPDFPKSEIATLSRAHKFSESYVFIEAIKPRH